MSTATAPSTVHRNVIVVQTYAIPVADHRTEIDHYEVHVAPDEGRDAQRTVLLTDKRDAYLLALTAEGHDCRVTVRSHAGQRGGKRVLVLDSMKTVP